MNSRAWALWCGSLMISGCAAFVAPPAPNDTVTRNLNEMKVAIPVVAPKVDDRDSRIAALERENQRLTNEAAAAQAELARLRSQGTGIDTQSASLQATSEELAQARLQLASLSGTVSERDQEIARLKALLDQQKGDLAKAERGLVRSLRPEIEKGNIAVDLRSDHLLISLASTMLFDSGQDQLKPAGVDVLKRVGHVLTEFPEYQVQVAGYTDNVPIRGALAKKFPSNVELSKARATNAGQVLEEGGIPAASLSVVGRADTQPVADNATVEGRHKNRRVEVVVTRK